MSTCLRFDHLVEAPNGGTTGLNKHYKSCVKKKAPKRKDVSQLPLGFRSCRNWINPKLVANWVTKIKFR